MTREKKEQKNEFKGGKKGPPKYSKFASRVRTEVHKIFCVKSGTIHFYAA